LSVDPPTSIHAVAEGGVGGSYTPHETVDDATIGDWIEFAWSQVVTLSSILRRIALDIDAHPCGARDTGLALPHTGTTSVTDRQKRSVVAQRRERNTATLNWIPLHALGGPATRLCEIAELACVGERHEHGKTEQGVD